MAGSDGTVRGTFDLNVGPAVRGVREYKREAAAADVVTTQLGGSMDRTFGREKAAQIDTVTDSMGDLGSTTAKTRVLVRQEWKGMRSDIDREATAIIGTIRGVKRHMTELGAMKASPKIDLDGITEALAQVTLLEQRLDALGRQRVTPRVALGGGVSGGGGGRGRGGGGNDALRSVGVGPFSLGSRAGLGFIAAGLPAVQALTGATVGLAGSLTGASLGAGAVGLSSGGALAAGIATVVAVAKPAQARLTEARKAQEAYTDAVADFGRKSREAAVAKREMDQAFGHERGLRRATRQMGGFSRDWRRLTAPGRASYYGLLGDVAQRGREVAPNLAGFGNRSMAAVRTSGSNFAHFATNSENLGTLDIATRQFARELPTVERTLENIALTAGRLYRASAPFFHDANEWVENWTGGWAESAKDIDGTRDRMRELIDEAKDWRDLSGSTYRLLRDIFELGAPSGDSLVVSLTHTMDRWDAWVKSNPTQVRSFFRDTADSVRGMADAMRSVVHWLNEMATLLRPLLDRFTQLVTVASQLGVLGAPGAFLAIRGGVRGGRGALGRGGAATGGRGGVAPVVLGGGAALGGASAVTRARALYGVNTALGGGRVASGLAAGSRLAGSVGMGALRGAGRAYLPLALGMSALDFATFNGGVGQKAQAALSSATLGVIHAPPSRDALDDRAKRLVAGDLATLGGENSRRGMRRNISRLELFRQNASGVDVDLGSGAERDARLASIRKTFSDEIRMRRRALDDLDKQQKAERRERARLRAVRYAGGLQGAFKTYKGSGQDDQTAFAATLDQVQDRLKKTKDAGVQTLGEGSLAWARAMAKGNPAMKKEVEELTDHIRDRFDRMGKFVKIVNGNILTGSKSEWRGIRDAMTGATEQARQKTSDDFTAIQQQAVGSLRAMGFTPAQARSLVAGLEKGGAEGRSANRVLSGNTKSGDMGFGTSDAATRARGGTVPGRGLTDTVRMGGAMVAPGETWIANRHTMRDLSSATIAKFGLTAEQMIRGETRRHSQRFATGGLAPAEGALVSRLGQMGFRPTSTTGGTHAPNSYHYRGMAADYGNSINDMGRLWSVLYPQRRRFAELFGPSFLKQPTLMHYGQGFSDSDLQAQHNDHIHVALTGGKGAIGSLRGGRGSMGRVRLHGVGLRQGGVPGVLRNRAGDLYAAGLQRKLNGRLSRMGGGMDLSGFHGGGSSSANMKLGHRMMLAAGYGEDQWPSLKSLWTRESGWSNTARNPTSGAFGIPQALPPGKMGARAVGGDAAAQIAWGLNYIRGRYGNPAGALAHENSAGWYARGGRMAWGGAFDRGGSMVTNGPTAFVAGEGSRRRERVTVTPANHRPGGDGMSVTIERGAVVVHIDGLKGGGDVEAMAEKVGEKVVEKVIEALDHGLGTVGE